MKSIGQSSLPVESCPNPLSALVVGISGGDGFSNNATIQLTIDGFKFAASSPRAPPAPFLS